MASAAQITFDTTAPDAAVAIAGTPSTVATVDVTLNITSNASDKAFMKIYGSVDDTFAPSEYRALEANAPWIGFAATKAIKLSSGDALKTIRIKVKDDVDNVSSEATVAVTLNTAIPTISITVALAPTRISKQGTKDTSTLTFQSDTALSAWETRLVPAQNSDRTAGTLIPATAGSVTSGGALAATTARQVTIKGTDLETAGAAGGPAAAGNQVWVKVFGQSAANGQWSVGAT